MKMQQGMRGRLSQYLSAEQDIEVELTTKGTAIYDTFKFQQNGNADHGSYIPYIRAFFLPLKAIKAGLPRASGE